MTKRLDFTMGRLYDITKRFVRDAKRYTEGEFYEPPSDQSHIWSELCSSVQHAEDTIEEIGACIREAQP